MLQIKTVYGFYCDLKMNASCVSANNCMRFDIDSIRKRNVVRKLLQARQEETHRNSGFVGWGGVGWAASELFSFIE